VENAELKTTDLRPIDQRSSALGRFDPCFICPPKPIASADCNVSRANKTGVRDRGRSF